MGLFKSMKDMKQMVAAAPAMIEQAQVMQANAAQYQAAQYQAAQYQATQYQAAGGHGLVPPTSAATATAAGTELLAPIAGVTVEQYVQVCKGIAACNYDQSMLPVVAAQHGIPAEAWATAAAGFNARVSASPAFAQHFNALYRGA